MRTDDQRVYKFFFSGLLGSDLPDPKPDQPGTGWREERDWSTGWSDCHRRTREFPHTE